ncbi:MAG: glycosyltransferase family 2 protein [Patescibacteria group bacterium]|jgi:glycosyltransferase involved in cell wall biosynthesis
MKVFCVIPAFNEEETIVEVIKSVKPFADGVIIVDDGSVDKTFELAKAQGVIALKHVINRGQGAALETGNRYAIKKGADIIVHFDADGQFSAEEINELASLIKSGQADIVFGSRFLGRESNMPAFKKLIIMPLARFMNRILFGADLSDPQCGFRAMSAKAVREIRIKNDGMAHCSEIIGKAFRSGLKIKEAPITVVYREFGQNMSGGIRIIKDLIYSKFIG